MEIVRFTYRIPKDLLAKVKVLALENNLSVNEEINQLLAFGIEYYFMKINSFRNKTDL